MTQIIYIVFTHNINLFRQYQPENTFFWCIWDFVELLFPCVVEIALQTVRKSSILREFDQKLPWNQASQNYAYILLAFSNSSFNNGILIFMYNGI